MPEFIWNMAQRTPLAPLAERILERWGPKGCWLAILSILPAIGLLFLLFKLLSGTFVCTLLLIVLSIAIMLLGAIALIKVLLTQPSDDQ